MKFWKIILAATIGTALIAGLYVYNRMADDDYEEKEREELDNIYE